MRTRVKDYTIRYNSIMIGEDVTIEDIRLIVNETQGVVICSSMQKDNVLVRANGTIDVKTSVCVLNADDQLTIEIDKGDSLEEVKQAVAKEQTLIDKAEEIKAEIKNAKPEIDLSAVAKQGENAEATNSAIYDTLNYIKGDVIDIVKLQLEETNNILDI